MDKIYLVRSYFEDYDSSNWQIIGLFTDKKIADDTATKWKDFYEQKRNFLRSGLANTKFKLLPSPGTYFQCVDYTQLGIPESQLSSADFCQWLTKDKIGRAHV